MSFLTDVVTFFKGNTLASSVVKVVALSYIAKKMAQNSTPANNTGDTTANIDQGVRLQVPPAANNKVPVLYGAAHFGGIITDAVMTNTNKTMFYALTLSEKTGVKLSDSQPSAYTFKDVYWNNQRVIFKDDAITVDYTVDAAGNQDRSLDGQVKFYFYAGNSSTPSIPENYSTSTTYAAYDVMPNWTSSTHTMSDLLFSIVRVDYNREKNVTGLGDVSFHVENSMKLPGDCLYDYMTNTRYGAGIDPTEIKVS